jgi:tetratricopeptide (TPR) repeat protein
LRPSFIHILFVLLLAGAVGTGCKTSKKAQAVKPFVKKSNGPVFASEADKMRFDNLFFDATKAKQLGRYDDATAKFEQCLTISANVPDVYYQLFVCYVELRRPGALTALENALILDPENTWYLEEKGLALRSIRKNAEAAEVFRKLVILAPDKIEHYDNAVEQYVMAGKPAEAIEVLDMMEAKFGMSEDVVRKKEDLYMYIGKPDKAIEEVLKLVNAMPANTEYLGLLAELYTVAGKLDKALESFNKILETEPNNGKAHFGLSNLYRQKGDSANTIKELKLGFEDPEVSVKEKINVIMSMAPLGDNNLNYRKQVFELAEITVKIHPNQPQAHAIYGDLLFGDNQYKKAAQQYTEALAIEDDNFRVWQQLLACYEQLSDFKNLHDESDKALELFPDRVLFYYYNANASYNLKNYKKAASTAQAGLDLGIGDKTINLGLYTVAGDAYYRLADYGLCFASFDAALEIDPNNGYVLNNYAYYLSEKGERLEKALSMAKSALALNPNSPAYLDTYGWILYKSERYTEALQYIQKALAQTPADMDILEHMGDVNYRLGNKETAVEFWRKSKENGNDSAQLDKKIHYGKLVD